MIKGIKIIAGLLTLALLISCQPVTQNTGIFPDFLPAHSSLPTVHSSATAITGKVEFLSQYKGQTSLKGFPSVTSLTPQNYSSSPITLHSSPFTVKATQTDISKQATVSLIYTSDYNGINGTTYRNKTIATGLSQDDGSFVVKPGTGFSPELNMVYVLEATRRIGSSGNDNMALRTYLKWNGTGWESMTIPGVYINATTTALSIIQDNLKYKLSSLQTIGKINILGNSSVPQDIGSIDKIVFQSYRDENWEIYSMNSDGSDPVNLTKNASEDAFPSFSPDSSKIVFFSRRDGGNYEIYTMNTDGSDPSNLSNNSAVDQYPSFSGDSSKIVYQSDRDGNMEIYSMNSDGTVLVNLTKNASDDAHPSFSPDSSKIVFVSNRIETVNETGDYEIYVMNFDGSNPTRLTNNTQAEYFPSFSPDSSKIVFRSQRDGNGEIYIMNSDGTNQLRLTNNSALDDIPSFSPDGSKIIFTSDRSGNNQTYIMNTDGSNQTRLTNNFSNDWGAKYSFYIKQSSITNVAKLITQVLSKNHDPMEYINIVNGKFKIVDPPDINNVITTIAGNGNEISSGDGGSAISAGFNRPKFITFDNEGNLYIATQNSSVRKIDTNGIITTFAGNGTIGISEDGAEATNTYLGQPFGLAFDANDNLFISDYTNHRIMKVNASDKKIYTYAGNGSAGFNQINEYSSNIPATATSLNCPTGIAFDPYGNLFFADRENHRIRKIDKTTRYISTYAGNTSAGYGGEGVHATNASLNSPTGISFDYEGNLFITERLNHRIRKVNTSGIITTVAGNGLSGYNGDGVQATNTSLNEPYSLLSDSEGNIFFSDSQNNRVRKIDALTKIITTISGNGIQGNNGDGGQALDASLDQPSGIILDSFENLYISNYGSYRIRKITR